MRSGIAGAGFQPRDHYLSGFTRFAVYVGLEPDRLAARGWNRAPAIAIFVWLFVVGFWQPRDSGLVISK